MARLAAHNLHVPLAQVTVHVGNTTLPVGPLASHSRTTASVLSAVRADGRTLIRLAIAGSAKIRCGSS